MSVAPLNECHGLQVKPELRSSCLVFQSDATEVDLQYVELLVDDVKRESEGFSVEEEKKGLWLIKGHPDGLCHFIYFIKYANVT